MHVVLRLCHLLQYRNTCSVVLLISQNIILLNIMTNKKTTDYAIPSVSSQLVVLGFFWTGHYKWAQYPKPTCTQVTNSFCLKIFLISYSYAHSIRSQFSLVSIETLCFPLPIHVPVHFFPLPIHFLMPEMPFSSLPNSPWLVAIFFFLASVHVVRYKQRVMRALRVHWVSQWGRRRRRSWERGGRKNSRLQEEAAASVQNALGMRRKPGWGRGFSSETTEIILSLYREGWLGKELIVWIKLKQQLQSRE